MKAIFKYRLPFKEDSSITIHEDANIIRVDGLDGAIWLWAVVDTNKPLVTRSFKLFKTGGEMPDNIQEYFYHGCGAIFVQMELMMYVFEHPLKSISEHIPVVNDFNWKSVQES